jgi:hypothetical protein
VESKQVVVLIKELIDKGYRDKHICLITKANQPYVSKIRNGKIHLDTNLNAGELLILTEEQRKRLDTLNSLIALPEIVNMNTTDQDIMYIHLLKFLMVEKEDVYNLYFHLSKKQFNRYWVMKKVDIRYFDSNAIGIDQRDYLDLIIDYFIDC